MIISRIGDLCARHPGCHFACYKEKYSRLCPALLYRESHVSYYIEMQINLPQKGGQVRGAIFASYVMDQYLLSCLISKGKGFEWVSY